LSVFFALLAKKTDEGCKVRTANLIFLVGAAGGAKVVRHAKTAA
jgi:hypothetical protein